MRDVNKTKSVTIDSDVTFNKQRVRKIIIMRENDQEILSGEVELSSTEHEVEARESVSVDFSEVGDVKGAVDRIESFKGSRPDLSNLSVSDLINSIVHEKLSGGK